MKIKNFRERLRMTYKRSILHEKEFFSSIPNFGAVQSCRGISIFSAPIDAYLLITIKRSIDAANQKPSVIFHFPFFL
jgi:hypothetical protein